MTVGELKDYLENCPDDSVVRVSHFCNDGEMKLLSEDDVSYFTSNSGIVLLHI